MGTGKLKVWDKYKETIEKFKDNFERQEQQNYLHPDFYFISVLKDIVNFRDKLKSLFDFFRVLRYDVKEGDPRIDSCAEEIKHMGKDLAKIMSSDLTEFLLPLQILCLSILEECDPNDTEIKNLINDYKAEISFLSVEKSDKINK